MRDKLLALFHLESIRKSSIVLSYYSLFALVPLLAYVLLATQFFCVDKLLIDAILREFPAQSRVLSALFSFAESAKEAAQEGVFAASILILYLFTFFYILHKIERELNRILETEQTSPFYKKLFVYPLMIVLFPGLALLSSALAFYLPVKIAPITMSHELLHHLDPLILLILHFVPILLMALLFGIAYLIIPAVRPRLRHLLVTAILVSLIYAIFQWGFAYLQIWVLRYNVLLGAFAAIPFFLLWIDLSWLIFLWGAKLLAWQELHRLPK